MRHDLVKLDALHLASQDLDGPGTRLGCHLLAGLLRLFILPKD
jgi:hypothetical protein